MKQDNTTTLQNDKGFTPGEWEEIGGDSKSRYIHANKPDGTLGKIVATAHGETYDETRGNAALIASAPQLKSENEKLRNDVKVLREALKNIVDYEERGRKKGEPRISETWYNLAAEALNQTKQD